MVSVQDSKKHLMKLCSGIDIKEVKVNGMENCTGSTVLLKADTGADVNLINAQTFDIWAKLKMPYFLAIQESIKNKQLFRSVRRGVICLIPKKERDPLYINNISFISRK